MALGESLLWYQRPSTWKTAGVVAAFVALAIFAKCDGDRRERNARALTRAAVLDSVADAYAKRERIMTDSARRAIDAANMLAAIARANEAKLRADVAELMATRPSVHRRGDTLFVSTPRGIVAVEVPADVAIAIAERLRADSVALGQALDVTVQLRTALDSTRTALAFEQRAHALADSALGKRTEERDELRRVKIPRYGFRQFVGDAAKVLAGIGLGVAVGAMF